MLNLLETISYDVCIFSSINLSLIHEVTCERWGSGVAKRREEERMINDRVWVSHQTLLSQKLMQNRVPLIAVSWYPG